MGTIIIQGMIYTRIPNGRELRVAPDGTRYPMNYTIPCWECHSPLGADHAVFCSIEQCPRCFGAWLTCSCGLPAESDSDTHAKSKTDSDTESPIYFAVTREHLDTLADQVANRVVEVMRDAMYATRRIEELDQLREKGIITAEEFEEKKADLLERM
jgi:Short C-terminal domain